MSGEDGPAQQAHGALAAALGAIRKAKTDAKLSVGTEVDVVECSAPDEEVRALRLIERDLKAAVRTGTLVLRDGEPSVAVTVRPPEV